jgi:hypothetical protein
MESNQSGCLDRCLQLSLGKSYSPHKHTVDRVQSLVNWLFEDGHYVKLCKTWGAKDPLFTEQSVNCLRKQQLSLFVL